MRTIKTKDELYDFTIDWMSTDYFFTDYFQIDTDTDEYLKIHFCNDGTYSLEVLDRETHLTVNDIEFNSMNELVDEIVQAYEMD